MSKINCEDYDMTGNMENKFAGTGMSFPANPEITSSVGTTYKASIVEANDDMSVVVYKAHSKEVYVVDNNGMVGPWCKNITDARRTAMNVRYYTKVRG